MKGCLHSRFLWMGISDFFKSRLWFSWVFCLLLYYSIIPVAILHVYELHSSCKMYYLRKKIRTLGEKPCLAAFRCSQGKQRTTMDAITSTTYHELIKTAYCSRPDISNLRIYV